MIKYYKTKATAIKHLEAGVNFNRKAFDFLRGDRDVALAAVKNCMWVFNTLPDNLRNDIEIAIQACSDMPQHWINVNLLTRLDRRLIMTALNNFKKYDQRIGLTDIFQFPYDFEDDEMMSLAVKVNEQVFNRCSEKLRSDPVTVLNAIERNALNFKYASAAIKNSKEIILSYIKQNSEVYLYIDQAFRDDKEIAYEAIKKDTKLIHYISDILLNDLDFMFSILKYSPAAYHLASHDVRTDCEFAYEALHIHKEKITNLPHYISDEIDIARYLVENVKDGYVQVSKRLRCDHEILSRMWQSKAKITTLTYLALPKAVLLDMKNVGFDIDNLEDKYEAVEIGKAMDRYYRNLSYDHMLPEKNETDKQIKI